MYLYSFILAPVTRELLTLIAKAIWLVNYALRLNLTITESVTIAPASMLT